LPQSTLALEADQTLQCDGEPLTQQDFLSTLDEIWQSQRLSKVDHAIDHPELPFYGGWFVYLGYELAQQIEPSLQLPKNTSHLPDAFATRIPAAVIHDTALQKYWLVIEAAFSDEQTKIKEDIQQITEQPFVPAEVELTSIDEDNAGDYLDGVEKIKRYIVEGDIFQVNLSRAWRAELSANNTPIDVFAALTKTNPSPFAALVYHEGNYIISSSPERLVQTQQRHVSTRPIAGTRPRNQHEDIDQAYSSELLGHPKERAEHIMLIDLERNDLGRICEPGSIHVDELMVLESYAHVHHIVSNVEGQLRTDITPGNVIRAVFPGGTITGCPKVRCMEIIAELENTARGPYTGSLGYLNHNGDMDLNILIRTMLFDENLSLRAGAGIVADSIPDKELDECRAKAKGLLLSLGVNI